MLKPPPLPSPATSRIPLPEEEDPASWEVVEDGDSVPSLDYSTHSDLSKSWLGNEETSRSDTDLDVDPKPTPSSDFDMEAFPPHSHLFPSSPNGTWRNESLHALKHPTTVDYTALCTKLRLLADETTDEVSARVNRAFEGRDVPAMHDKVLSILPSVSMPNIRDLERAVDAGCEWGVEVLDRRRTRSRRGRW
jgi:hypothetical protein